MKGTALMLAFALGATRLALAAPTNVDLEAAAVVVERAAPREAERALRATLDKGGRVGIRGLLAVVLARQDRDKEAGDELRRGLAVGPTAAVALRAAAFRLQSVRTLLLLARLQAEAGDGQGALATLAQTRELAPNSEELLVARAQLALALRTPIDALPALDDLTRLHPTVVEHHYLLGVALLQAGDPPRATEELQEAERLDPEQRLTLVALGLALNQRKLYDQSLPYLERSLEREPENSDVLAALAEAEEGTGRLTEADAHATRALAHSPRHAGASFVLGLVRMRQERYAEARDALLRAVAADVTSAKAHYQLSQAFSRLGDEVAARREQTLYEEARRASEKAAGEQLAQRARAQRAGMGR